MTAETIAKLLIPAGIALSLALGGASWRQAITNEHRVTSAETVAQYQEKTLDANIAKLLILEAKFDNILLSLGRIEGQLAVKTLQSVDKK